MKNIKFVLTNKKYIYFHQVSAKYSIRISKTLIKYKLNVLSLKGDMDEQIPHLNGMNYDNLKVRLKNI